MDTSSSYLRILPLGFIDLHADDPSGSVTRVRGTLEHKRKATRFGVRGSITLPYGVSDLGEGKLNVSEEEKKATTVYKVWSTATNLYTRRRDGSSGHRSSSHPLLVPRS